MKNQNGQREYYPNFDLIRLLLASEVVIAHVTTQMGHEIRWPIIAVPAFLAISGFLVLKSYEESKSWSSFAKKRMLRILPALCVSIALCGAFFGWIGASNSILNWITGGLSTHAGFTNIALWSLAWEEVAYLFLAILWKVGAYRCKPIIWCLTLLALALSWFVSHSSANAFYQILAMLPTAFLLGNLAYLYRDRIKTKWRIAPWMLLLIVLTWRYLPQGLSQGHAAPFQLQAFSLVWVSLSGFRAISFRFPDISYGIYIYHMPLLMFIIDSVAMPSGTEVGMILTGALVALCVASWYFVERPALRFKNRNLEAPAEMIQTIV